jgi:hypothetical protein
MDNFDFSQKESDPIVAFQRWLNLLGGDVQLFYQGLPNAFNHYILKFSKTNILSVYLSCKGDYVPFMSKVHKRHDT